MHKFWVHTDSSHGWLAVKRALLIELGLMERISMYSYERGQTVYLEEDCDAGILINELKSRGIEYSFKDGKWVDRSPIRSYYRFSVKPDEVSG